MTRPRPRRLTRLLACLAIGPMLALTACAADSAEPEAPDTASGPVTAETLRLGIIAEEGNLTPHTYQTGTPGLNLTMLSYDNLMQIDTDGVPQPWLAETVEASEDGLTYTVELRPGVTWQDGEALTAQDVAFSVDYYKSTAPGRFQTDLRSVESATAQGDTTVTFALSAPDPSFELRTLADVPILPEHIWSGIEAPENEPFSERTNIGSGPYRLVDAQPGTSYRFEANPDYFRGAPKVDELVAIQFADDAGAIAALRAGEVDTLMRTISPEQIQALRGQGGLEVIEGPEYSTTLLAFNTQQAPFDDIEFRQAVASAVDVQSLVENVYLGAATPGNRGWVHPDSPFYNPDVRSEFDPDAAMAQLDEAGYEDSDGDGVREAAGAPLSLELLVPGNNALRLRIAELLAEQLGEVGIGVDVAAVEDQTLIDQVWPDYDVANGRNYQMAVFGWSAPTQADIGQMAALVDSDPAVGNLNITGYSDPAVDELAAALKSTVDQEERRQVAYELQTVFAEQVPFVPLLYPNGAYGYQSAVFSDWVSITGQGPMSKLSFIPADGLP